MTTVEISVQHAVLTAIESLVNPRVEMAMEVTNASPGRSVDGNILDADQREFRVRSKAYK